jgi:hypothetical protein
MANTAQDRPMSNVYASTSANPAGGGMPGRSYKELAIWSLICAIWVFPPAGIIMGMIARRYMRASNNFEGRNIARAGIIAGAIFTALYAVALYGNGAPDVLLGGTIGACVPLYFVLQIWFAGAWSGRWRIAALVPLIGFLPILVYSLVVLAHSSNLWPLALIFFSPLGVAYLLAVRVVRAVVSKRVEP